MQMMQFQYGNLYPSHFQRFTFPLILKKSRVTFFTYVYNNANIMDCSSRKVVSRLLTQLYKENLLLSLLFVCFCFLFFFSNERLFSQGSLKQYYFTRLWYEKDAKLGAWLSRRISAVFNHYISIDYRKKLSIIWNHIVHTMFQSHSVISYIGRGRHINVCFGLIDSIMRSSLKLGWNCQPPARQLFQNTLLFFHHFFKTSWLKINIDATFRSLRLPWYSFSLWKSNQIFGNSRNFVINWDRDLQLFMFFFL